MTSRLARLLAAVLIITGGIIHYQLWTSGYRGIPKIGPLFMANFVASIVLGVAVALNGRTLILLAGVGLAAGSLTALVLSRTVGVFGFTEMIWTPQAVRTLAFEVGALAALAVPIVGNVVSSHRRLRPALVGG